MAITVLAFWQCHYCFAGRGAVAKQGRAREQAAPALGANGPLGFSDYKWGATHPAPPQNRGDRQRRSPLRSTTVKAEGCPPSQRLVVSAPPLPSPSRPRRAAPPIPLRAPAPPTTQQPRRIVSDANTLVSSVRPVDLIARF